jgi:hypothetical protein
MIAGPVAGSLLSDGLGQQGLVDGALVALTGGCFALLVAAAPDKLRLPRIEGVHEIIA